MGWLKERYFEIGEHSVRVLEAGSGSVLVLLLASPLIHAGLYQRTVRAFAGRTRVAVVDLPGCGMASRVERPPETDEYADLIPELTSALDAESAVLIGHSNSGPIAIHAAVRYPGSVAALVLADSVGAHPSHSLIPVVIGRSWDAALEPRLTLLGLPAIARNVFRHTGNLISQIRRSTGDELLATAAQVKVPTVLAWGRRDHTTPLSSAFRFQSAIEGSTTVISETGSHDWIIEEPGKFVEHVMAALPSY